MKRLRSLFVMIFAVLSLMTIQAEAYPYVVVTASNDMNSNELLVYDSNGNFMQSIPTNGRGGVAPNIVGGGIAKFQNLVAVINYNSQNVSVFRQRGNTFELMQVIPAQSKPVSLAFGYGHLYVLGTNTIESHRMNGGGQIMEQPDGVSRLFVGDGSGAQVGVLPNQLIISERTNSISTVDLQNGVVTNRVRPVQLPPPPGNDTPVGLVTRGDVAYVTIAHSDKVGIVRNGQLIALVSSQNQHAPCWLALSGPWLYSSNTPSKSISKYNVTENTIVLAEPIVAMTQNGPSDMDADESVLAVLDTGNNMASVTQFQVDNNGNLMRLNNAPTAATANGVAIVRLQGGEQRPQQQRY